MVRRLVDKSPSHDDWLLEGSDEYFGDECDEDPNDEESEE